MSHIAYSGAFEGGGGGGATMNLHEMHDNIMNLEQYFEICLHQLHGFLYTYTREGYLKKHFQI